LTTDFEKKINDKNYVLNQSDVTDSNIALINGEYLAFKFIICKKTPAKGVMFGKSFVLLPFKSKISQNNN